MLPQMRILGSFKEDGNHDDDACLNDVVCITDGKAGFLLIRATGMSVPPVEPLKRKMDAQTVCPGANGSPGKPGLEDGQNRLNVPFTRGAPKKPYVGDPVKKFFGLPGTRDPPRVFF